MYLAETIALEIVDQMTTGERATYTVAGWSDGVSAMLTDDWEGADLDHVLEAITACIVPTITEHADGSITDSHGGTNRDGVWHS
jgi:hypothetical protein